MAIQLGNNRLNRLGAIASLDGDSVNLLRWVLEADRDGALLLDSNRKCVACNHRFGEIFGLDPEKVLTLDPSGFAKGVLPVMVGDQPELAEEDLVVGPSKRIIRRLLSVVANEAGEPVGELWTFRDVTRERRFAKMQQVLQSVSFAHSMEPEAVCSLVLKALSEFYDQSTSILSIRHDDYMEFKGIEGPKSPLLRMEGNALGDAYCQFALRAVQPILIQNSRRQPEYAKVRASRAGYTRYLGVPVYNESGEPVGTLCILDNKSAQPLDEQDLHFLSLMAMRVNAELAREKHLQERMAERDEVLRRQQDDLEATRQVLTAMNTAFGWLQEETSEEQIVKQQIVLLHGLLGYSSAAIVIRDATGKVAKGFAIGRSGRCVPMAFDPSVPGPLAEAMNRPGPGDAELMVLSNQAAEPMQAEYVAAARLPDHGSRSALLLLGRASPPPFDDPRHRLHVKAIADQIHLSLLNHHLQRSLFETNEQLTATHARLVQSEKLSVVGTLAASTAHDIRNILSSLSLVVAPGNDPAQTMALVREQLDRFGVLAHRLLSYAKPKMLAREEISIPLLLQRVLSLTSAQMRVMAVVPTFRQENGLLSVEGDPNQLEHLFVNLILNGVQAMDAGGGKLSVQAGRRGSMIVVKISDTGKGLSREIAPHMFEPFATTRQDGFGLGLYSCKRIIDAHGGTIRATKNGLRGTSFIVELPAAKP